MTSPTVPTEALLAESAWLRKLARRLVRDEARAEDLVQDTLVAALEREEAGRVPGRPWLAAVLRNVARLRARSGARRAAREAAAAPAGAPATDEVVARLEAQRRLVEAVLALEEPYRTTLALRFLEGLSPREVARRMGAPVKTVHTRTDRALAQLKARLDRAFGRRDAWCSALARLAGGGLALPLGLGTLGGLAMGTAIKWGGAAALLVGGGLLVQSRWSAPGTPASPPARVAEQAEEPAALAAPLLAERDAGDEAPRTSVASAAPSSAAPVAQAPAAEVATFSGRAVDEQGRPVAGVLVVFKATGGPKFLDLSGDLERRSGVSDAEGIFRLPLQSGTGSLVARDERWANITTPVLGWMPPPEPPVVVVGPKRNYGGVVVGEDGAPVAEVDLFVLLAEDVRLELEGDSALAHSTLSATSDEAGRFLCEPVGFSPGAQLVASSIVGSSKPLLLPDGDALDLTLTVDRRLVEDGFAGRVVDAHGEGVAGAHVSAGGLALETDAQGYFTLGGEVVTGSLGAPSGEIAAVKEGFLPARLSFAELSHEERQKLVLVLDGVSASIAGTVVDAAGEPVPRAFVWTFDSTPFGFVVQRLTDADSFSALFVSVETIAAGESAIQGMSHAADAEGRFEFHGLLLRSYALFAMHPETLSVAGPLAIESGEQSAILRLRDDERSGVVAGRVTNLAGEPFEGVSLAAYRRVADATGALRDPPFDRAVYAKSAPDGTFSFGRLALEETHFVLRSDDGPVVEVELEREAHPEALALSVPEVRHVRVVLSTDPDQASEFRFEDAEGQTLTTTAMAGNARASAGMHSFSGGSSGLVATDERARFLVLFKQGVELRRVPLTLQRGQVTEVRL